MIIYNEKDFNLDLISSINSTFNTLETKVIYYIYGLTQNDNPPVVICQNSSSLPDISKIDQIGYWLDKHGITMEFDEDDEASSKIKIGLRRDLRAEPKFAAALVRTFVAFFEGALKLKTAFKLPKAKLKKSNYKDHPYDQSNDDGWNWNS